MVLHKKFHRPEKRSLREELILDLPQQFSSDRKEIFSKRTFTEANELGDDYGGTNSLWDIAIQEWEIDNRKVKTVPFVEKFDTETLVLNENVQIQEMGRV